MKFSVNNYRDDNLQSTKLDNCWYSLGPSLLSCPLTVDVGYNDDITQGGSDLMMSGHVVALATPP